MTQNSAEAKITKLERAIEKLNPCKPEEKAHLELMQSQLAKLKSQQH